MNKTDLTKYLMEQMPIPKSTTEVARAAVPATLGEMNSVRRNMHLDVTKRLGNAPSYSLELVNDDPDVGEFYDTFERKLASDLWGAISECFPGESGSLELSAELDENVRIYCNKSCTATIRAKFLEYREKKAIWGVDLMVVFA